MFNRAMLVAIAGLVGSVGGSAGGIIASNEYNPIARHFDPSAAASADDTTQRVIVRLRGADAVAAIGKPASDPAATLAGRVHMNLKSSRRLVPGLHVMEISPAVSGEPVSVSLARLRADPAVQYAEIDQRRFAHAVPNDPLFAGQWYLQNAANTPSAVNAQGAWDKTTGSTGLVIADLDTGIRFDHPDLLSAVNGGRLLPGYDFISVAAIANDGDGRDSDPSDPGDWITSADAATATFSGCTVENSSWHGTRTAGILAAIANNNAGVSGLTWRGFVLPVRVLGKCGGYDSDIVAAMLWAGGIHVDGVPDNTTPAKLENMSLGSKPSALDVCPSTYQDVVSQLAARGVLVVASAGNEGGPVDVPANCPGVAAVGGLRHMGTKVGYSNVGTEVLVSAPAGNCVNPVAGQPCLFSIVTTVNLGAQGPGANSYTDQINYNVGTSFSAPIVTAIAGLMLAANGNLRPAQLMARLQEGAVKPFPVGVPTPPATSVPQCHVPTSLNDVQGAECNCTTTTCGAGMANALGSVNAALRPIVAIAFPNTITAGQNVVLQGGGSAAACGHSVTTYAWTVVSAGNPPAIQGAQTGTATVVAPTSGSFTLRLTVTDEAGRQDSADVIVNPTSATTTAPAIAGTTACLVPIAAAMVNISVSPTTSSLVAGSGTQAFTATVTNTSNTALTWQVNGIVGGNASVGTISTDGLYSAPATVPTPANVTVTAVAAADTMRSATATITITAPVPVPPSGGTGGGGGGGALDWCSLIALGGLACLRRRALI